MTTTTEVNAHGGWQDRGGERVLALRVQDPGNSYAILEIELSERAALDLLSNRHSADANATLKIIGGERVIGQRHDIGDLTIDRPDTYRCDEGYHRGSMMITLPEPLADELERLGWAWDKPFNGHRLDQDGGGYHLQLHRLVAPDTPHPIEGLQPIVRGGLARAAQARPANADRMVPHDFDDPDAAKPAPVPTGRRARK